MSEENKPPTATVRRVARLFSELLDPCEMINERTIACGPYRLVVTDVERGHSIMMMKQGVTIIPTFEYFLDPVTDNVPLIVKRFIKYIGDFK